MSNTTRSALTLLILAACSLAPDGPDGLSGGAPASTSAGSSGGGTTSGGDDSSGGSTDASTGEDTTTTGASDDGSTGSTGEPTACGTPAIYEACAPACPASCEGPGVCLEPDGDGSAFCSAYCNADPECPASTHGDYPTACALSLCWIACNDQIPDKPCPFGYWCWDPGADVQRPVCLPEGGA